MTEPFVIKNPGKVRRYIKKLFGKKAFKKDGTIKLSYLREALRRVKDKSLKKAIRLAIVMKTKWKR